MKKILTGTLAIIPAVVISASINNTWAAEDVSFEVKIPGKVITYDKNAIIDEINRMRKEAIENDYFKFKTLNKVYTPIVWNDGLVNVAMVRAAEATVVPDHAQLDGKYSSYGEVLAWNQDASGEGALKSWYNEKNKYEANKEKYDNDSINHTLSLNSDIGHYLALVSPSTKSIGLAGYILDPSVSTTNFGAVSGAFSSNEVNSNIPEVNMKDKTYVINPSSLAKTQDPDSKLAINNLQTELPVKVGTEDSVDANATIDVSYYYNGDWKATLPVVSSKWTSSNPDVISMGKDGAMTVTGTGTSNISLDLGGTYKTEPKQVTAISGNATVNELYPYLVPAKKEAQGKLEKLNGLTPEIKVEYQGKIANATSADDINQIMAEATKANEEAVANVGKLEEEKYKAYQELDKYYNYNPFMQKVPQEYYDLQEAIERASSVEQIKKILAEAKEATSPTPAEPPKENTGGETTNSGENQGSAENNQDHGAGDEHTNGGDNQLGDTQRSEGESSTPNPNESNVGTDEEHHIGETTDETPGESSDQDNSTVKPGTNGEQSGDQSSTEEEPGNTGDGDRGETTSPEEHPDQNTPGSNKPSGNDAGTSTNEGNNEQAGSSEPEPQEPGTATGEENPPAVNPEPNSSHENHLDTPGEEQQGGTNSPGTNEGEHATEEQPGSTNEDNDHEATVPGGSENHNNNNTNENEPQGNQTGGTNDNAGDGSSPEENEGNHENSGDNHQPNQESQPSQSTSDQPNQESEHNSGANHESQPDNSEDNQINNGESEDNHDVQPPADDSEEAPGDEHNPPQLTPEDVAAIAQAMKQELGLKAADLLTIQDFLMKQKRLQTIVNREDTGLWATVDGSNLSHDGTKVKGNGITVGYDAKLNHNRLGVVSTYTNSKVGTTLLDEKTKAVSVGIYNVYTNKNFFAAVNLDYQGNRLDDLSKINSLNTNLQVGIKYKIKEGLSITPQVDYGFAKVSSDDLPNKIHSKYYGGGLQVNYSPSDKLQINTSFGLHRIVLGSTKLYMPKFQDQPGYFVNVNSRKDTAYTMQISLLKDFNKLFSLEGNLGYTKLNNTKLKGFSYGLSANYKF